MAYFIYDGNLYNLITVINCIIIVIVIFYDIKNNNIKRYSLLMIFGGALGNFYDRIFYTAVPDFIDFHIGEFHWFVFNVADIFISIGVFLHDFIRINCNNKIQMKKFKLIFLFNISIFNSCGSVKEGFRVRKKIIVMSF